jgi:hypothetical protein
MLRLDVDGHEAGEAVTIDPEKVDPHFPVPVGIAAVDTNIIPVLVAKTLVGVDAWSGDVYNR